MANKRETLYRLSDGGITVRVFRRKGIQTLQLEVDQRRPGYAPSKERRSFGHTELAKAKEHATTVFAQLMQHAPLLPGAPLTVAAAIEKYLDSAAFKVTKQRTMDERRSVLRWMVGFEDWRVRPAIHLGQEDLLRYFQARIRGEFKRGPHIENVSRRRAQAELQMLRTALNWAYATRVQGRRLLTERVFDGLSIPGGGTPSQPAITEGVFHALWSIRHLMHPAFAPALALAEAYGKRGESIRHVQWTDITWAEHSIFWNPEHDKEEESGTFWMPSDVEAVLNVWWTHPSRPDSQWVFAAPKNPDEPIGRTSFGQWMNQAYRKAGLTKPRQGGWHALRRWFSTRNAGENEKAAMRVAGMRNVSTFFRYQQPEPEALKQVLQNRPLLIP